MNDLHSRTAGGLELRPTRDFPYILKAKFDTEVPPAPPPPRHQRWGVWYRPLPAELLREALADVYSH